MWILTREIEENKNYWLITDKIEAIVPTSYNTIEKLFKGIKETPIVNDAFYLKENYLYNIRTHKIDSIVLARFPENTTYEEFCKLFPEFAF